MTAGIRINIQLIVDVDGVPCMKTGKTMVFEAHDEIKKTVPANTVAGGVGIEVQPGGMGQVELLVISSSKYGKEDSHVSYSINSADDTPDNRIKLDSAQVLMGEGAVGLLGQAPNTLYFYNQTETDADIHILVGRQTTPP
jgi:hypothetical protein